MMIAVNLLPRELRPRRPLVLPRLPIIPIAAGCLGVLVLFYLSVLWVALHRSARAAHFERVLQREEPGHRAALAVQEEVEVLRARTDRVRKVLDDGLPWAEKMQVLSDRLPDDVWLTRLTLDPKRREGSLEVEGFIQSEDGEAAVTGLTGWVEALKADDRFMRGLVRLELGPLERDSSLRDGDAPALKFILLGDLDASIQAAMKEAL